MRSKGQTLIAFVIILPVLFMAIALIVNLCYMSLERRKIENVTKEAVTYGIKNIDEVGLESKIENLIKTNYEDAKVDIKVSKEINYVRVKVVKGYEGLFKFLNTDGDFKVIYGGTLKDNQIVITKED